VNVVGKKAGCCSVSLWLRTHSSVLKVWSALEAGVTWKQYLGML
jgi:hypothetical protein